MTDVKKNEPVGAATPANPLPPKEDPDEKQAAEQAGEKKRDDELAIENARIEEAEKKQKQLDAIRSGDVQSMEGARPEYEPPIGTKPVNPIPSGLVVGGPVLDLEEQARLARMKKGPEQAPGTKPV